TRLKASVTTGEHNGYFNHGAQSLWFYAGALACTLRALATPWTLCLEAIIDGHCYTTASGCSVPITNVAKTTFDSISDINSHMTPDLWKEIVFKCSYQTT
ncbi:hypothetical protein A6R68_16055, partial [Neotoma lepida]